MLDENLNIKLSKFFSAQLLGQGILIAVVTPNPYRAPEIYRGQIPYDGEKADVFSLAVVLFALVLKSFPFTQ